MPKNWNKGFNKYNHPSILKRSETMKERGLDNFKKWRDEMKRIGKIKSEYPELKKNGDLAELIGVVLGDGHIGVFPRSESLLIFSNSNNPGFIKRYAKFVEKFFNKKPVIVGVNGYNCTRIRIYEKFISKRLGVPSGARKNKKIVIPEWIFSSKRYILRYLRGLYEAEGSFCEHLPTYTHKAFFTNRNISMLENVYMLLCKLGFHPHKKRDGVQISKREEVNKFKKLIKFREY